MAHSGDPTGHVPTRRSMPVLELEARNGDPRSTDWTRTRVASTSTLWVTSAPARVTGDEAPAMTMEQAPKGMPLRAAVMATSVSSRGSRSGLTGQPPNSMIGRSRRRSSPADDGRGHVDARLALERVGRAGDDVLARAAEGRAQSVQGGGGPGRVGCGHGDHVGVDHSEAVGEARRVLHILRRRRPALAAEGVDHEEALAEVGEGHPVAPEEHVVPGVSAALAPLGGGRADRRIHDAGRDADGPRVPVDRAPGVGEHVEGLGVLDPDPGLLQHLQGRLVEVVQVPLAQHAEADLSAAGPSAVRHVVH